MRPGCSGAGGGSGATGSGSGAGAGSSTLVPVHSRKLPHEPQKLSDGSFWSPHFVQTITWRFLVDEGPRRRRRGRAASVRAW